MDDPKAELQFWKIHCVKSVRIWSSSGLFSVRMWENTEQKNSEYGHLLRIDWENKSS